MESTIPGGDKQTRPKRWTTSSFAVQRPVSALQWLHNPINNPASYVTFAIQPVGTVLRNYNGGGGGGGVKRSWQVSAL